MSATSIYKCTNEACDFELSLNQGFPIWKENTPKECRKVPVLSAHQKYLKGRRSEYFCKHCKTVVEVSEPIWYPFPTFKDSPLRYFISKLRRFFASFDYYPKTRYVCPNCKSVKSMLLYNETCPMCKAGIVKEDISRRVSF